MKLLSINIAAIGELFPVQDDAAKRVPTAIRKKPAPGSVAVHALGLAGDAQADLRVHGGPDKAVYAYPFEHYAFWSGHRRAALQRDMPMPPGTMGENLTIEGLLEKDVWVGDQLRIADAVLEVTAPREPCFKFNAVMGFKQAAKLMIQSGTSGFYLSVVQPGTIHAGDAIVLAPGPRQLSIPEFNERRRTARQPDLF